jgi:hypothetical protein
MAVDSGRDALMFGVHPGRLDRHALRLLVRFGVDVIGACSDVQNNSAEKREEFAKNVLESARALRQNGSISTPSAQAES